MDINQIEINLREIASNDSKSEQYREFHKRIINDLEGLEIIGVRTPNLRKIAKEISKNDWQEFLNNNNWSIYEMKQITFLLPSYLKNLSLEEFFKVIDTLIPHTLSWANCDALGSKLPYDKDKMWSILTKYLSSKDCWEVRIGLNFVFANYLKEQNIDKVLEEIMKIDLRYREKVKKGTLNYYYVKMMLAWLLAEAAVKHKNTIEEILPKIDLETAKYAKQKMRDSFRI